MKFDRLTKNLISVIKEAQIKLGYEQIAIGVNYVSSSLINLLGDVEDVGKALLDFASQAKDIFGDIEIKSIENGYRLTVSPEGAKYVHSLMEPNEFLACFINEVRNPLATIDSIIAVFKKYSDNVVVLKTEDNDEFDYVIYFEDGVPDEFWYCIDTEDLGMTYHRFIKEDYLDFGF